MKTRDTMNTPPPLRTTPPPLPGHSAHETDSFDGHLEDPDVTTDEIKNKNIITLRPIETNNINLSKNEFCYFEFNVIQIEDIKVTDRVNYRGPMLKVKIIPGLSYRMGSVKVKTRTHEERITTDSGLLFLTSKRVFFDGQSTNRTFRYPDIAKYFGYKNGIEFENQAGKIFFYEINKHERKNIEFACRILDKFMDEQ